ncbi:MAG: tRNA (5-methylaminomethyl-2-thiouridine)(34)-methyltransferase MnmD [Elainellaceae cyanobacterium]
MHYPWTPRLTDDGSFTFFSDEFGETFHSQEGAKEEAFLKFAAATGLSEKAQRGSIRLLDICYGLGYNTAAAIETVWATSPHCHVELIGLELDAAVPQAAIAPPLIESWSSATQDILKAIAHQHFCQLPQLSARLLIGDARQTIQQVIAESFQADAILFDPFSPRRCPQLWTVEFFHCVAQCLASDGTLATYSRSASVRAAMIEAGLSIGTIPVPSPSRSHDWSHGTIGSFKAQTLMPLSIMEQEHLRTRAAVPYRDPCLTDTAEVILSRHHREQQESILESTSSWRRRWGIR